MKSILSIQSYVTYGYVGNRAAVFPLQRLGFDVTAINTVQFSNHTGYPQWQGDIFTPEQLYRLIDGIRELGAFPQMHAILSGYMGSPALGALIVQIVQELKASNPALIYCCDPVIGDVGRGVFVRPGVGEFFKNKVIEHADILTPNQFELAYLTGQQIGSLEEATLACDTLSALGPQVILVTSLIVEETPADMIEMLLYTPERVWKIQTPRFRIDPAPNGAGDLTAALLLAQALKQTPWPDALEAVAAAVHCVFEKTFQVGSRELQLIASQESWVSPERRFKSTVVR